MKYGQRQNKDYVGGATCLYVFCLQKYTQKNRLKTQLEKTTEDFINKSKEVYALRKLPKWILNYLKK